MQLKITLTGWAPDANYAENNYQKKKHPSPGRMVPSTFRLIAEHHKDFHEGVLHNFHQNLIVRGC